MSEPKTDKRVKLFVPRGSSHEDPNYFISINGVNYLLPKGKESLVPEAVAAEYRRCEKAQAYCDRQAETKKGASR